MHKYVFKPVSIFKNVFAWLIEDNKSSKLHIRDYSWDQNYGRVIFMYAAQNGYIFIGESLLLVLSKHTFTDMMYKYFYRVILFGYYTIYLLICNSLRKVIIQFSRNLHSFLIPIEREHLYVWVNHLVSLTLTCKSTYTWWNVVNTINLSLPCKKYYIH